MFGDNFVSRIGKFSSAEGAGLARGLLSTCLVSSSNAALLVLYFLTGSTAGFGFIGFVSTAVVATFSSSDDDSEFLLDTNFLETNFSEVLDTILRGLLPFLGDFVNV